MSKARILIIVGDQDAAHSLESQLTELDYEVVGKIKGEQNALNLAVELSPDLVMIAPFQGGEGNEIGLAEAIQAEVRVPVVFVSHRGKVDDLNRIRTAKPSGFVWYPCHPAELSMTVEIALDRQRSKRRLAENEVTYRSRAENTLRRRDLILNAVGYAAEQFFKSPDWQEKIQEVLGQLGRTTNSSRVYIFENHQADDGSARTSMRFEWAAQGVAPRLQTGDFQNIDLRAQGLSRWAEVLDAGGFLHRRYRTRQYAPDLHPLFPQSLPRYGHCQRG